MSLSFHNHRNYQVVFLSAFVCLGLSACQVKTQEDKLSKVEIKKNVSASVQQPPGQPAASGTATQQTDPDNSARPRYPQKRDAVQFGERFDPAAEEVITEVARTAWKRALEHDDQGKLSKEEWKKARAEDEAASMAMMQGLKTKFPASSTVDLMMAQIKRHFGDIETAARYYASSSRKNRYNTIAMIGQAEMDRTKGNTKRAVETYRKLLEFEPTFIPAQIGLADCLLKDNPSSKEGAELVDRVLAAEPENHLAVKLKQQVKPTK